MEHINARPIRIAIVEDVSILRKGLSRLLSSFGTFSVEIEAENGRELLQILQDYKGKIDICLLDIKMPEMDGHATIIKLKQDWPDIKVLVLSIFNDDYNIIRMLRNGANGYILKSCSPEELDQALHSVYHSGFYHSELVNGHIMKLLQSKDPKSTQSHTDNEIMFLSYCCSALTYKEIAELMRLSARTIEGYRDNLYTKLGIKSRTGLVMYAMQIGIKPYGAK